MLATILFLLFLSLAQSQETQDLLLEDLKSPYDEYTSENMLCYDLNVTISFANLNLAAIQKSFLSSPLIRCLNLNSNSINSLYSGAFDNLPNLKYLDLSDNNFDLSILLKDSFLEIETLILNNCRSNNRLIIQGYYPKVKKLFLKKNGIYSVKSAYMDNLLSLTHLYLSDNEILANDFNWLPVSLKYLDLSRNNLNSLTLKNLINLEKLFIDDQYGESLKEINTGNLINLKYLSSKSNSIGDISTSTFRNATSLTYLDISNNKIKYIESGSFDSMKNLQFLNLSNNYLEILQAGTFDQLQNLETLILDKNLITVFPMIGHEIKLQYLILNCNKIKNIIGGTFSKMRHLKSLYLHDNELSYIDQEAFRGLENLKILTLSNNQLSSLPHYWMASLNNLKELDLIGNLFSSFGNLALESESSSLQNVYLSKQLEYINSHELFGIPDNVTIHLREGINIVEHCNKDNKKYRYQYYG